MPSVSNEKRPYFYNFWAADNYLALHSDVESVQVRKTYHEGGRQREEFIDRYRGQMVETGDKREKERNGG